MGIKFLRKQESQSIDLKDIILTNLDFSYSTNKKMKRLIISLSLIFVFCLAAIAQNHRTHKVKPGDTVESIARQYNVTPYDIFALNPDAKSDFNASMVLLIPNSGESSQTKVEQVKELQGFKTHKVRRKETLFSISKRYDITIDEIKQHNNRLYSEHLRKGDKIKIPQYKTILAEIPVENTLATYVVQPKEGKWRIAYKYGVTVEELELLNPKMSDTLKVGETINVPNIAMNEVKDVDENYGYYTVLPKEGFYRLKLKLELTQEELEELNPELKEGGLKSGMVLKVPKDVDAAITLDEIETTSLISRLKNFKPKRLAVMLPFQLQHIDTDSINEVEDILEKGGYTSIAVDFHTGVLMALDSVRKYGISITLDVFDTQARTSQISEILSSNDFSKYDAVIGPFTSQGFDRTAETLKNDDVPVISAVTMPKELYGNVYQTLPSEAYLRKLMVDHIKADSTNSHIIIISDEKNRAVSNALKSDFTSAKQIFTGKDKDGKETLYVLLDDVKPHLKPGRNFVFLETSNEGFVSNVSSMLSALNGVSYNDNNKETITEIILMTTNKNKAYEGANVSNLDLSNLQFHFPSVNRTNDTEIENDFVSAYRRIYETQPNRYATRGFDLTMDILLRLAYEDDFYMASDNSIETQYVENKFRYNKKMFGGYYNEAAFIIKYQDLKLVEVKE